MALKLATNKNNNEEAKKAIEKTMTKIEQTKVSFNIPTDLKLKAELFCFSKSRERKKRLTFTELVIEAVSKYIDV
jgi:predicted DNA repair protein MutK